MFRLNGEVSSENLNAIHPLLAQLLDGHIAPTPDGLHLEGLMEGDDARDVNRRLLSAMRRVERRTRLRAEWTADGVAYRFFDYALKSERPALLAVRPVGRLPPVVDDVGVACAVARLVGTVHRHALEVPAKAPAGEQFPGAVPAGVRAGDKDRRAAVGGQPVACVDEQAEPAFRARTWPDGAELDVTRAPAGLRARTGVTDGHALQAHAVIDPTRRPSSSAASPAPGYAFHRVRT